MLSWLWPLGLFALSVLDAAGLPVPAEAVLVGQATTGGSTVVALLVTWIGFVVGDVVSFELWRRGWRRVPPHWHDRVGRLRLDHLGPVSVAVTRLLPISAFLNIVFARSSMSLAAFGIAAGVGDLAYTGGVLLLGVGGFAIFQASPTGAIAIGVVLAALIAFEWLRRRRRGTSISGELMSMSPEPDRRHTDRNDDRCTSAR
jgi:uncharacterized membrane protein YdjX (TVP38/TMEM64 family)